VGRKAAKKRSSSSAAPPPAGALRVRSGRTLRITAFTAGVALVTALGWGLWRERPAAPSIRVADATDATAAADPGEAANADLLLNGCEGDGAALEKCVQDGLDGVLRTRGQRAAFAQLARVASSPRLSGKDHGLAHHLGHSSYAMVGDAPRAIADCPPTMGSGCLHGVVEAYFLAKGPDASVVGLCQSTSGGASNTVHQCWHGVGHGLYMTHGYEWAPAVKQCMAIPEYLDRVNCSSGVFMQNGMDTAAADTTMAGHDMSGMHHDMAGMQHDMPGMHHSAPERPRIRADNLLYPCDEVRGEEAEIGCWQMQPFNVLKLTGSYERAFWMCGQAHAWSLMCEEGIGQAAGAQSRIDNRSPLSYCGATTDKKAWRNCMVGAVKEVIVHAHSIAPGISVCGGASADYALDCYGAVGMMNRGFQPNPEVRLVNCSSVAEPYRRTCAAIPGKL